MGGSCCSEKKETKSTNSNTDDTDEPQNTDKPQTVDDDDDDDFCGNDTMGIIPPEEPTPQKGWFRGKANPVRSWFEYVLHTYISTSPLLSFTLDCDDNCCALSFT